MQSSKQQIMKFVQVYDATRQTPSTHVTFVNSSYLILTRNWGFMLISRRVRFKESVAIFGSFFFFSFCMILYKFYTIYSILSNMWFSIKTMSTFQGICSNFKIFLRFFFDFILKKNRYNLLYSLPCDNFCVITRV